MHTIFVAGQKNQIVEGEPFVEVAERRPRLSPGDPWQRLAVWTLSNGDGYAVRFRPRIAPIEPPEVGEALRIRASFEDPAFGGPKDEQERTAWLADDVMRFFEWSWLAKELAESAGWPTSVVIDAPQTQA